MAGRRRSSPAVSLCATITALLLIWSYVDSACAIGALPSGCFTAVGEYLLPNSIPQLWLRKSRLCSDGGTSYNFTVTLSLTEGSAPTFQAVWGGDALCPVNSQLVLGIDGSTCHFNGSASANEHQFCTGTIFSFSGSFPYGVGTASTGDVVIGISNFAGGPYSPVFYCEGACSADVLCSSGEVPILGVVGTPNQIVVTTTDRESVVGLPDELIFPGSAEATDYLQAPEVRADDIVSSSGSGAPSFSNGIQGPLTVAGDLTAGDLTAETVTAGNLTSTGNIVAGTYVASTELRVDAIFANTVTGGGPTLPQLVVRGGTGVSLPNIDLEAGAGVGATIDLIEGMYAVWTVTITAGVGPLPASAIATWISPFTCQPWVATISPSNLNAAVLTAPLIVDCNTAICVIRTLAALLDGVVYKFSFVGVCVKAD